MATLGTSTEIESGYIQASSTGTISEDIGFRPDYIEFISAQQIESTDFTEADPENNDCPDNVNGWSEGSVIFGGSGIDKQFSIGMFRNSDSTNGHITSSSTNHVIRNVYTSQDGNECGRLEVSVSGVYSNGFEVNVEGRHSYDEIVRYKAYQFPDNMEFDAGMVEIDSSNSGSVDVNSLGFQPANLHIRAGQQISSKNSVNSYWRAPAGRSKGYATLDESGNVIDQQSIGTASSSDSTNAHRSLASDQHVLNTVYVDQNADVQGRLEGAISGADSDGFTMNIEKNTYGSDEIFLYRAWGSSYYEYDVGYKVINTQGTHSFTTEYQGSSFEPDAIDIYAEQQISSINDEVVTDTNNGCANAGGWSNGFYETADDKQWALSTGRTSDSQDSHRYGASTSESLLNLYNYDGNDCGNFKGTVVGASSSGFEMDIDFDSNFDSNYGEEMVYYRAFNFQTAPPQVTSIEFYNSTDRHAFGVIANVTEGSNDISSCEVTADYSGYSETYNGNAVQLNSTHSQCRYEWIRYDDNSQWEDLHDNNDQLLEMDVTVEASDIDGLSSQKTDTNRFPNHRPNITGISYNNYSTFHGFEMTAELEGLDTESTEELGSCELEFSDDDGNVVAENGVLNHSFGDFDDATCNYDNVNSSMPYPSGVPLYQGFEVLESIDTEFNVTDHHDNYSVSTDSNTIPNSDPFSSNPEPQDGGVTSSFPVILNATVNDLEGDELNATIYNQTGGVIGSQQSLFSGGRIGFEYDFPESTQTEYDWIVEVEDRWGETNTTYSFTKIIGRSYRSGLNLDLNYSSIVLSAGDNEYTELTISNNVEHEKNLTVNLTGVETEFLNGDKVRTFPNFEGQSSRTYMLRVTPEKQTSEDLTVVVTNNELGIKTEKVIDVETLSNSQESNEVPGIGIIQFLFLLVVSTVLYSVRL